MVSSHKSIRRAKWFVLAALFALALLLVLCPQWHREPIEADLGKRTASALLRIGLDVNNVRVDGRDITLIGTVNSELKKENAGKIAALIEGVRTVDNQLAVSEVSEPAQTRRSAELLIVRAKDRQVHLTGLLPDQKTITDLINAATVLYGDQGFTHDLKISAVVDPPPWLQAVLDVAGRMKGLEIYSLEVKRAVVRLEGEVVSETEKDAIGVQAQQELGKYLRVGNRLSIRQWRRDEKTQALKRDIESLGLDNIYFRTSSAEITSQSLPILDRASQVLAEYPDYAIEIAGHTDSTGEAAANLILSQQGAEAIRDYLIRQGIQPARLVANGYGASHPIGDNSTPEGRAKNRRIEFNLQGD